MPLTFPLSLAEFFTDLEWTQTSFYLTENRTHDETAGGEIFSAGHGPRLWAGDVSVNLATPDQADEIFTRAELLSAAGASFFITHSRRRYPQTDPDGSTLSGASPVFSSTEADTRLINLGGCPTGFVLKPGDFVSWEHGSPAKYALHRVVTGGTAGAGGQILDVEINPPKRGTPSFGDPVQLLNAFCKAVIVPGSLQPQQQNPGFTSGFSFSWRQTLK